MVRRLIAEPLVLAIVQAGLLAAVAAGGAGCQPTANTSPVAPASRGAKQALVPDENGRVHDSTTGATGIRGQWFAAVDAGDCQKKAKQPAEACSRFITPDLRSPSFRPTDDLGMCVVGVAARTIARADGVPDWDNLWGARIGLTLNDGEPYDAAAHRVSGLAFHIDSEPPPNAGLRVQVRAHQGGGDPPLWGGATAETSPVHAGQNQFRWKDVAGPPYLENPPAVDPSHLISIEFTVPTSPGGARSFSFCIRDVAVLLE